MPYSFLHIAALRNDITGARGYIEGGLTDNVHVWKDSPPGKLTVDQIDVDVRGELK